MRQALTINHIPMIGLPVASFMSFRCLELARVPSERGAKTALLETSTKFIARAIDLLASYAWSPH